MLDGLIQLVAGRFVALVWHGIATIVLILGKTPLIQTELDPTLTADLRDEQFEHIDTWWVLALLYSAMHCFFLSMSRSVFPASRQRRIERSQPTLQDIDGTSQTQEA